MWRAECTGWQVNLDTFLLQWASTENHPVLSSWLVSFYESNSFNSTICLELHPVRNNHQLSSVSGNRRALGFVSTMTLQDMMYSGALPWFSPGLGELPNHQESISGVDLWKRFYIVISETPKNGCLEKPSIGCLSLAKNWLVGKNWPKFCSHFLHIHQKYFWSEGNFQCVWSVMKNKPKNPCPNIWWPHCTMYILSNYLPADALHWIEQ